MITWSQWLHWAKLELITSFSEKTDATRDSEILLGRVTNKSRTQLLAFGETPLTCSHIIKFKSLIARRVKKEPIAYLIGSKEFWSLNFKVASGMFIPRPDTECLVEQVLYLLSNNSKLKVLDLGTGVGTIALAIASERPNWNITGIDCQKEALLLANHNKLSFSLKNTQFKYGNWFQYLTKKNMYHLIISNPPYIGKNHIPLLSDDIINFESKKTWMSEHSGLADLTVICRDSTQYLYPKGWLVLEHGWDQGKIVRNLLQQFGFTCIQTKYDYHQRERVTLGQWKL